MPQLNLRLPLKLRSTASEAMDPSTGLLTTMELAHPSVATVPRVAAPDLAVLEVSAAQEVSVPPARPETMSRRRASARLVAAPWAAVRAASAAAVASA